MIKVIGKENCSRCEMVKNILTNKGIEYEYQLLDECENKAEYIKMAREKGQLSMPLIIQDNKIIDLQEVIA